MRNYYLIKNHAAYKRQMDHIQIKRLLMKSNSKMSKAQPLSKGTTILQEKPFAYVIKQKYIKERCDFCCKSGKLLKCGGCQHSHYCNVICQRDAWAEHKYECLCMKKIAPRIIPDAARILAKIIWKLQYGGYLEKFYYSKNGYRKFHDLMAHLHEIKWDKKRTQHAEALYAVLQEYLATYTLPNFTEFLGIYGRLCINGFNLQDEEGNSIGTAIYLATSILDHSCKPNAVAVFDGPQVSIRLIEDIPELDWKNIRISYIDIVNLPEDRKKELKEHYYFDCDCERCSSATASKNMKAAACPKGECDGAILIDEHSQCPECKADITDEFKQDFRDIEEATREKLDEMQENSYIDVCNALIKRQNGVLHAEHILRMKSLDLAFETAINCGQWDHAAEYGTKLLPTLKKYTFEFNPLIGLTYMKLGKIHLHIGNFMDSIHNLREAADVLKISHGEESTFVKKELEPLIKQAQKEYNKDQLRKAQEARANDSEEEEDEED